MTDSSVLRLEHAAFTHPGGGGVADLELEIASGEAVALIGPNGAGKSTLLKGVLGLVPLTAGRMVIGSSRSDAASEAQGDAHVRNGMIGFLPQSADLDPDFPISLEQVVMQGRFRRMGLLRWPRRADRMAVRQALETVGLADLAKRRFGELSGGQRQRGLLARALQRPCMPRAASMALVSGHDEGVLVDLDLDALEALLDVAEREHLVDGPARHLGAVHEQHRVADESRQFEVVRRDQHRHALAFQRADRVDEGVAVRLVEAVERFVEEQQPRF